MNRQDRKPRAIAIARTRDAEIERRIHMTIASAYALIALAAAAIVLAF